MNRILFFFILAMGLMMSCAGPKSDTPSSPEFNLVEGDWLMNLQIHEGVVLPVNLRVSKEEGGVISFINGTEVLVAHVEMLSADSLRISMPYFESEFLAVSSASGTHLEGNWYNLSKGPDYFIPFTAEHGTSARFCDSGSGEIPLGKRYEVHFSPDSVNDHYPALGLFEGNSADNSITGTFATETGDYRFLQGNRCGDTLMLSCFDGSHAFLFHAIVRGDSLVNGRFYSGKHWQEPWIAKASSDFNLRDPYTLTHVIDSSAVGSTRFIMEDGKTSTLAELKGENEVVILQIMGSWCPNCLDESEYFKRLYGTYSGRGLRILPLCFEASEDPVIAYKAIHKLEEGLELPYPMYYGGKRSKSSAAEALPALDHIMSYPTSVFIDKKGKVRSVHTGFYGPSTGIYFEQYSSMTDGLIKELLSEN
jgi:thiol-disulfide isomerase/thioredoxin